MDLKELRIGNLVYNIDGDGDKYSQPVLMVSGKEIVLGTKQIPIYTLFNEFIQPIPITEDWLKRFGFEKKRNDYEFNSDLYNFWYLSHNKNICVTELENQFSAQFFFEHIKYLHQLQNLYFALTGEELTLND